MNNSKKSNPIAGFFLGFIFVIGGLVLLWWNEGRTVKTEAAIKEAEGVVIDVSSDNIDSSNEGKLIATKGLQSKEEITDGYFGIVKDTSVLKRTVETYQWVEECEEDDDNNKECRYEKKWEDSIIDSKDFQDKTKVNPTSMKFENQVFYADKVKAGQYEVPEDLVKTLSTKGEIKLDDTNDDVRYTLKQLNLTIDETGKYYTDVVDNQPEIGNVRVSFTFNNSPYLSMIGVQSNNTIKKYQAKSKKYIYGVYEGEYTGAEMLQIMREANNFIKVVCRVGGILLIIIGFLSIISPLQKLASYVPIIGSIFNGATTIIAVLLGIALGLVDIAIAWFAYRPILSISLLAGVAVIIALVVILKKKGKQTAAQPAQPEQPVNNN